MNKKKNLPMIIMCVILALVLIGIIIYIVVGKPSTNTGYTSDKDNVAADGGEGEKWQEGVISYNGKRYKYNNKIDSYLFLGIEEDGVAKAKEDGEYAGCSDALFLMVVDNKAKEISVIAIHRNTMTEVMIYNRFDSFVTMGEEQICLQHAYGDGLRTSANRTVDAVKRLFYNIPISGYLTMRMGAVPIANDAIGGVTLEVIEDVDAYGVNLEKGKTYTLKGKEAYAYIRDRSHDFDGATGRLNRQIQYLDAYITQAKQYSGGNVSKVMGVYEEVEDYIVSSIDFANLAEEVMEYGFDTSRMYSLEGETIMGEELEEFHVDDDALYELILEVFYDEVVEES